MAAKNWPGSGLKKHYRLTTGKPAYGSAYVKWLKGPKAAAYRQDRIDRCMVANNPIHSADSC